VWPPPGAVCIKIGRYLWVLLEIFFNNSLNIDLGTVFLEALGDALIQDKQSTISTVALIQDIQSTISTVQALPAASALLYGSLHELMWCQRNQQ
jgi:hypothetical protein